MARQSRLGESALKKLGALLAAQQGCCFYCGNAITLREPGHAAVASDATIDHFFSKQQTGLDGWRNWVLACSACNNKKADRLPTADEMARWNALAAVWPAIEAIDLSLVQSKRCSACHRWIDAMRLGRSMRSGHPTSTCRPDCKRKTRHEKAAAGKSPLAKPVDGGPQTVLLPQAT